MGADAETALVEEVAVTPGNVNDGRAGSQALPDDPGDVYADSAYRGQVFGSAVVARGGRPKVVQTSAWGRPGDDTLRRLKAWNWSVNRVRCRIEKIFGTWKRSYGLRRMRWRGIAKRSPASEAHGNSLQSQTHDDHSAKRDSLTDRRAEIASRLNFATEFKLSERPNSRGRQKSRRPAPKCQLRAQVS